MNFGRRDGAFKGQVLSQQVEAELYRVYYDKVVTGTEYDFINRTTRDSYRYERREDLEDTSPSPPWAAPSPSPTFPAPTGTTATMSASPPGTATAGLVETTSIPYSATTTIRRLQRRVPAVPADEGDLSRRCAGRGVEGTYYYYANTYRFADGEDVSFTLQHNDEDMAPFQGKLLYAVVQDDFQQMGIVETGQVALSFDEPLYPATCSQAHISTAAGSLSWRTPG